MIPPWESPEAYILYTNSRLAISCGTWQAMYITNCYSKVVVKIVDLANQGADKSRPIQVLSKCLSITLKLMLIKKWGKLLSACNAAGLHATCKWLPIFIFMAVVYFVCIILCPIQNTVYLHKCNFITILFCRCNCSNLFLFWWWNWTHLFG